MKCGWNYGTRSSGGYTDYEGEVRIRALVHALAPLLVLELDADEGERHAKLKWYAYPEVDPILKNADGINLNQYIPDTTVQHIESGEVSIGIQEYGSGDGRTTAWITHRPEQTEQGWEARIARSAF